MYGTTMATTADTGTAMPVNMEQERPTVKTDCAVSNREAEDCLMIAKDIFWFLCGGKDQTEPKVNEPKLEGLMGCIYDTNNKLTELREKLIAIAQTLGL